MPASVSGSTPVSSQPTRICSSGRHTTQPPAFSSVPPPGLRLSPCLAGHVQGAACHIVREAGIPQAVVEAAALADLPAPIEFSWPGGFETRYEMGEVLGKGSFGTVRTAFDRNTGRTLAVKIIPKSRKGIEPERILHRIREEVRHFISRVEEALNAGGATCFDSVCEVRYRLQRLAAS